MSSLRSLLLGGLVCLLVCHASPGLTLDDVVLHHSFEKGLAADMSRADPAPAATLGSPQLVQAPGREGKVLKLRNGVDALAFRLPPSYDPTQGAISFHLSAVDWDGSNGDALQVLMHTNGSSDQQQLVVQTLWPWGNLLMPLYHKGELVGGFPAGRTCSAPMKQGEDLENVLKTGYFYHYLITWRDGYQAIYLNGRMMNEARIPEIRLRQVGDTLYLGWNREVGRIFWDPGCDDKAGPLAAKPWQSLLDDVTLLRAFVFPHEAARIHELGAVAYARRAEPSALALEAEFYQTLRELAVQLIAPGGQAKDVTLTVQTDAGVPVLERVVSLSAEQAALRVDLPLPDLPDGWHRVRASLATGFVTDWVRFEKVTPAWLGNDLGKADVVLPPWAPIRLAAAADSVALDVWGRQYRYTSPLPDQVTSLDEPLLAGKVQWYTGDAALRWSPVQVTQQSPTTVTLTSTARCADYQVAARTRIEYDGFTWSDFTFQSEKAGEIGPLRVDIPLDKNQCTFLQYPTKRDCWFPHKGDWSSGWQPYILVASDERGLQWFTESDQWWQGGDAEKAIEVVKTPRSYVLRLNIVREAMAMPASFNISFGLMATPVRPRPANWRGWGVSTPYRLGHLDRFKPMSLDYSWWGQAPGWLVPNQRDPKNLDPRGWGGALWLPFTSTTFRGMRAFGEKDMGKPIDEWRQFAPEWLSLPEMVDLGKPGGWNQSVINPTPSFIDRYAWEANELFANWLGCQGLYYDGYAGKEESANLKAGFGYVNRDGVVRPTFPIRAGRELQRRVYALLLKHKPEGVLMMHPATSLFLPVLSFSQVIYDGEFMGWGDISHAIVTKGLHAGLTDDKTRFLLNYKALGLVPSIDTRWVTRRVQEREGTMQDFEQWHRLAFGRFLVDDVHSVPLESFSRVLMAATDWWGLDDPSVQYLPHYAKKPAATTGWADYSSCWVQPQRGRVLIATLNHSGYGRSPQRQEKDGKGYLLKLDLEQLGLEPGRFRVTDAESLGSREIAVVQPNVISLQMDPWQLRLLAVEKTP